jgi:hypothetical protein
MVFFCFCSWDRWLGFVNRHVGGSALITRASRYQCRRRWVAALVVDAASNGEPTSLMASNCSVGCTCSMCLVECVFRPDSRKVCNTRWIADDLPLMQCITLMHYGLAQEGRCLHGRSNGCRSPTHLAETNTAVKQVFEVRFQNIYW